MDIFKIKTIVLIIGLTLLSGFGDSRGFVHAANIWKNGKLIWQELVNSGLGFTVGILSYWLVIKYLQKFGIVSAEMQTLGWFGVTIVGVAILSGHFAQWKFVDQIVAVAVLSGIGWLLVRTGG